MENVENNGTEKIGLVIPYQGLNVSKIQYKKGEPNPKVTYIFPLIQ